MNDAPLHSVPGTTSGSENKPESTPKVRPILEFIAAHYGLTPQEIINYKRTEKYLWPRHVGMYLASQLTGRSSMQIAKVFQRDNSTVRHAKQKIARLLRDHPEVAQEIEALENGLLGVRL